MNTKKVGDTGIWILLLLIVVAIVIGGYSLIGMKKTSEKETTTSLEFEELAEICHQASLNEDEDAYFQFRDLILESKVITRANCDCGGVHSNFPQGINGYLKSKLGRVYWKGRISIDEIPPAVKECNRLIDEFTTSGKTDCSKIPRVNGLFCSENIKNYNTLDGDNAFSEDSPFYTLYLTGDIKQITCS